MSRIFQILGSSSFFYHQTRELSGNIKYFGIQIGHEEGKYGNFIHKYIMVLDSLNSLSGKEARRFLSPSLA